MNSIDDGKKFEVITIKHLQEGLEQIEVETLEIKRKTRIRTNTEITQLQLQLRQIRIQELSATAIVMKGIVLDCIRVVQMEEMKSKMFICCLDVTTGRGPTTLSKVLIDNGATTSLFDFIQTKIFLGQRIRMQASSTRSSPFQSNIEAILIDTSN